MWGIQPSEFWSMEVTHWWWLIEVKKPVEMCGSITKKKSDGLMAELLEIQKAEKNG